MDDRATLDSALAGRYDIDHEIGRGGMATVYLARDLRHDREVAIKVLHPDLGAALDAPGDLTIHDVSRNGTWLATRDVGTSRVVFRQAGDSMPRPAGWLDYEFVTVVSGDGRQLALGDASAESGPLYSVLLRSDTGTRTARLGDGWPQQFSPDGKWVLAIVPSEPMRLMLYGHWMLTSRDGNTALASLDNGSVTAIKGVEADRTIARWAPSGAGLWVADRYDDSLQRLDPVTGALSTVLPHAFGNLGDVRAVIFADDPRIFAAVFQTQSSELFDVSGVR